MTAYYNENDPKAAAWLRELIRGGYIAEGEVDERSIEDVTPLDVAGYAQCHFFAGIGGWSYALRLAAWPDDKPVWTGSCPCQPFSAAGKGAGFADERHLWPAWFHLIRECRPVRIFGEQVASALPWLDLVSSDLEGEGYTIGAAVLGAHSVGAPHIRQRLYWMADAYGGNASEEREQRGGEQRLVEANGRALRGMSDADRGQLDGVTVVRGNERVGSDAGRAEGFGSASTRGTTGWMADRSLVGRREERTDDGRFAPGDRAQEWPTGLEPSGVLGGMADRDTARCGLERSAGLLDGERSPLGNDVDGRGEVGRTGDADQPRSQGRRVPERGRAGELTPWTPSDFIQCSDGKSRPAKSGIFPLAHGVSGRVGLLRGYGNAIVPQVAAAFIEACA